MNPHNDSDADWATLGRAFRYALAFAIILWLAWSVTGCKAHGGWRIETKETHGQ